ncbi:hypothetical protein ACWDDN_22175 [Streptomyces griseoruber]
MGVRSLINAQHDVIALQEAGRPPLSAGHFDAQGNWASGPAQTWGGFFSALRGGVGWTVEEYEWQPSGSRGGIWYIYFMQTDFGANRVNLAIVSRNEATAVNVARPAFTNAAGQATSRPALGIRLNNTYFWSVHALANGGTDTRQLLENIDDASGTRPWAALGDWNREPQNLVRGQNMHIYRTGTPTHYGGNGNNHELDYMVTNEVIPTYTPGSEDLGSDHRAVYYYPLRARADVQIRVPHDGNRTVGLLDVDILDTGHSVAVHPAASTDPDTHWQLEKVTGANAYNVVNNSNKECWDASGADLITPSNIFSSAGANTFYLGRPWHNGTTVQPQTVIRDSTLPAAITTAQPWTDMDTTYHWTSARFFEYHNSGAGAGVNSNRPQLTDSQAGDYTVAKYLAGTDGWDPIP